MRIKQITRRDTELPPHEAAALRFIASMYAVQLDQLAALLPPPDSPAGQPGSSPGGTLDQAREVISRWSGLGYVECRPLTFEEPWAWLTRRGQAAVGVRYRSVRPSAYLLRHCRAVTEVRLAAERRGEWRAGGASWRSEREILSALGFPSGPVHIPDGEVLWPGAGGARGEAWAIEVEVTRKPVARIADIMRELLARTTDYDPAYGSGVFPGDPPRYSRIVYCCHPLVTRVVRRARDTLGYPLGRRVEVLTLSCAVFRPCSPQGRRPA
jgi:hypothetical protein